MGKLEGVDIVNRIVVGWVWEAVENEFMKFWHIKSVDKSKGVVKLRNVAKPHIKAQREIAYIQRYGRTRKRTKSDKKLTKGNPLGGR